MICRSDLWVVACELPVRKYVLEPAAAVEKTRAEEGKNSFQVVPRNTSKRLPKRIWRH